MKKLLFVSLLLLSTFSAQAMDTPDILDQPLKFYPLTRTERPKATYIVELEAKSLPRLKANYALKENLLADGNCPLPESASDSEVRYCPSVKKELEIRFKPGQELPSIVDKKDAVSKYIVRQCCDSKKSKRLQFEDETPEATTCYRTHKTQKIIGKELRDCRWDIQEQGQHKLLEKNAHLDIWIKSFLAQPLPFQENYSAYYSIHRHTFLSAVKFLTAVYGGQYSLKPDTHPGVYLLAEIHGQQLMLLKKRKEDDGFVYKHRMIRDFKEFLKKSGFHITGSAIGEGA